VIALLRFARNDGQMTLFHFARNDGQMTLFHFARNDVTAAIREDLLTSYEDRHVIASEAKQIGVLPYFDCGIKNTCDKKWVNIFSDIF
jgi:hypothetical protein